MDLNEKPTPANIAALPASAPNCLINPPTDGNNEFKPLFSEFTAMDDFPAKPPTDASIRLTVALSLSPAVNMVGTVNAAIFLVDNLFICKYEKFNYIFDFLFNSDIMNKIKKLFSKFRKQHFQPSPSVELKKSVDILGETFYLLYEEGVCIKTFKSEHILFATACFDEAVKRKKLGYSAKVTILESF
jgi:hypothetical protein